jgi:tetratricopeptide (TPR) repeat protein
MTRVVELEPKVEWHKLDLAQDCFFLHRYQEAETLLNEAIAMSPGYWEAYEQLFKLYTRWQGDFEKARVVVQQSEEFIDSTMWVSYLDDLAEVESNYAHATSGITMPPLDSFDYHYNLGLANYSMRDIDSSRLHFGYMRDHYDGDVDRLKDDAWLNRDYALMFAGLGEQELAIKHMNRALELFPRGRYAWAYSDMFTSYIDLFGLLANTEMQVAYMDSVLSMPNRAIGLGWILVDPDFREAVHHPDFKTLMANHADSIQWRLYEKRYGSP